VSWEGVGEPLRLTTADGVAFTVVSRNAGNGKQIVVRPQVSGSLNESFAFNMEDVVTKEKPEAHRAYGEALQGYLKNKKLQRSENLKAKPAIRKHLPKHAENFSGSLIGRPIQNPTKQAKDTLPHVHLARSRPIPLFPV